ncbi:MAG: tetratricopeptide repeat protein, partial [bacterium]|nr:tetratricopeptide repeat protein [Candidatus Kapabacteria bacterium]
QSARTDELVAASRRFAERKRDSRLLAIVRMLEANSDFKNDGSTSLIEHYAETDAELKSADDRLWQLRLSLLAGDINLARGEFTEARALYDESRARAQAIGSGNGEASSLSGLASIEQRLGNPLIALELLHQAEAICERVSDRRGLGRCLGGVGAIHNEMGDHTLALDYFERALAIGEEIQRDDLIASCATNIGNVCRRLKRLDRAVESYERAIAIRRGSGDRLGLATTLANLASVQNDRGQRDDALASIEEALKLRQAFGNGQFVALIMSNKGALLREMGRTDEAIAIQTEALTIACENDGPLSQTGIHDELATSYEADGRPELALHHLRESHRIKSEWRSADVQRRVSTIESVRQVELARKEAEIERLRTVELVEAHEALQSAHRSLEDAHAQLEQTHRELKHAQSQLVHAEKMASLGQLTAGIAHEINNPVNFIRNSTSPLRRDLDEVRAIVTRALADEPPDLRERVESRMVAMDIDEVRAEIDALLRGIEDGASRTAEIVKGLRTFARLDEDVTKLVDLREGIDSTLVLLRPRTPTDVQVTMRLDSLPLVECRPGQINQVLMNIIANALDAVGEKGEVTITGYHDDSRVEIEIADTG